MTLATVVIPVQEEDEESLSKIVYELKDYGFEVIVVDDGATMTMPSSITTLSY